MQSHIANSGRRPANKISIAKSGYIRFNKAVVAKHDLDSYDSVVLCWKPIRRELGLEFIKGRSDLYAINIARERHPSFRRLVNAAKFFKVLGIDRGTVAGRYSYRRVALDPIDDDKERWMLVLSLE